MGKILLNYDNTGCDGGIIVGAGATPLLPLSNLQTSRLEYPWRSASTVLADTKFDITLSSGYPVRTVALLDTNATTAVKAKATAFNDSARTDQAFTTGWEESGARVPFGELTYGSAGLYTGFTPLDDPWRKPAILLKLDQVVTARYWTIEIDDRDNPDAYFQAARLWMSRFISPPYNFSPDAGFGTRNNTREQTGFLGQKRRQRRAFDPRRFSFQIQYLSNSYVLDDFYRFLMRTGFEREVLLLIDDAAEGLELQRTCFLGQIEDASPHSLQAPNYAHVGYTIEEIIR